MNKHMQLAALHGLFIAVWESMTISTVYIQMIREVNATEEGVKEYSVNGRLAHWTMQMYSYVKSVSWRVKFRNPALGELRFHGPAGIEMSWFSSSGMSQEMSFTDEEFAELFETLRHACATYIRHYGFSVDQKTSILRVIFAP